MKIYIAGKITGDPNYREKFERVADLLRTEGHIVLNPAEMPQGMEPADYMRICFAMIDVADAVVFQPGWSNSKGASLEYDYCQYTGKQIMYYAAHPLPTIWRETAPLSGMETGKEERTCETCADYTTEPSVCFLCAAGRLGGKPTRWRPRDPET